MQKKVDSTQAPQAEVASIAVVRSYTWLPFQRLHEKPLFEIATNTFDVAVTFYSKDLV